MSAPQDDFPKPAPHDDESPVERRVAFAAACFMLAIGLVALGDAAGAPARAVAALGPLVILAGLAAIGLLMRSARISRFFAGARAAPPAYAGAAAAGAASGLALPFLPPLAGGLPAAPAALAIGLVLGLAGAAFGAGPLLRKSGAYSLADLAAGRFGEGPLRACCAVVAALAGAALAIVGLQTGAAALHQLVGASLTAALFVCAFVTLAMALPGGLQGVTWSGAAAGAALATGALAPLAAALGAGEGAPLPILDESGWRMAVARIAQWSGAQAGETGIGADAALAAALALGLASLAPLVAPAIAAANAPAARRAGLSLLVWAALIALGLAGAMAMSTGALDDALIGQRPQALPPAVYLASDHGLLTLCGATTANPVAALQACREAGVTGALSARDVWASGLYLVAAAPELKGMSAALTGLIAAGLAAAGLALAATGALSFATACAHDLMLRARGERALTSRRLASARLCLIVLVAGVAIGSARGLLDARALIVFACALSAATLSPILLLALWPRAAQADALRGFCAGAGIFALATGASAANGVSILPALGVGGLAGFASALVAGLAFSLRRGAQETRAGRMFVAGVLHGEGDLLNRDDAA